ncbi:unnamed protein product [Rhodiola kirilowii]
MLDQGLSPDIVTFTVLINALAKMGKGKEARELFLLMIQSGKMPDVVTYNTLMDCIYNEGNIEELKEVFVSMDKKGITASVVSYNILIKGYCKHEGMFLKGMESEAIELKRDFLAKKEDIDDFLVRGASLKCPEFATIVNSVTGKKVDA